MRNGNRLAKLLDPNPYVNGSLRLPAGRAFLAHRNEQRAALRAFLRFHARAPFVVALVVVVVGSFALPALLGLPLIGALAKGVR